MFVRSALSVCLIAAVAAVACGGNDTTDPPAVDAQTASVTMVTCPASPAATFTTGSGAFSPTSATIAAGQIIKIVSTADHPIGPFPDPTMTDPVLVVPETQTRCFQFAQPGTFKFMCMRHFYPGTVTVN